MEAQNNRSIDDLFRQSLGGYREAPPPAAWDNIVARLDEKRERRRGAFFRWPWAALLLVLLIGGGAWMFTTRFNATKDSKAHQPLLATAAGEQDYEAAKNARTDAKAPAGITEYQRPSSALDAPAIVTPIEGGNKPHARRSVQKAVAKEEKSAPSTPIIAAEAPAESGIEIQSQVESQRSTAAPHKPTQRAAAKKHHRVYLTGPRALAEAYSPRAHQAALEAYASAALASSTAMPAAPAIIKPVVNANAAVTSITNAALKNGGEPVAKRAAPVTKRVAKAPKQVTPDTGKPAVAAKVVSVADSSKSTAARQVVKSGKAAYHHSKGATPVRAIAAADHQFAAVTRTRQKTLRIGSVKESGKILVAHKTVKAVAARTAITVRAPKRPPATATLRPAAARTAATPRIAATKSVAFAPISRTTAAQMPALLPAGKNTQATAPIPPSSPATKTGEDKTASTVSTRSPDSLQPPAAPSDTSSPQTPKIHGSRPISLVALGGYEAGFNTPVTYRLSAALRLLWNFKNVWSLGIQPAFRYGAIATTALSEPQAYQRRDFLVNSFTSPSMSPSILGGIDTLYNYVIRETFDSIIVMGAKASGSFWEVELPLILDYKLSDGWHLYGGPSLNLGGRFSTTPGTSMIYTTFYKDSLVQSQPKSEASFQNYFGTASMLPQYSNTQAEESSMPAALRFGYLAGVGYGWNRLSLDASIHGQVSGIKDVSYALKGIYRGPTLRISVGYLIFRPRSRSVPASTVTDVR